MSTRPSQNNRLVARKTVIAGLRMAGTAAQSQGGCLTGRMTAQAQLKPRGPVKICLNQRKMQNLA